MRKLFLLAPLLLLAPLAMGADAPDRSLGVGVAVERLNGRPVFVGVISSGDGGVFSNLTTDLSDGGLNLSDGGYNTAGRFDAGFGAMLLVNCTCAAYLGIGTATTSAWEGVAVAASEKFYATLQNSVNYLSMVPASGAVCRPGCYLYRME